MTITLNGEARDVTPDTKVRDLIVSVGLKPELVAVQINDEIVPKPEIASRHLCDGDVIELIRIVGGG